MAAITSLVLTAIGIGASVYSAKRSRDQQKRASRTAENEMGALEAQRKERESLTEADRVRQQARGRQKALMAGSFGRESTMLTGSLGVLGDAPLARKNLLGP